jgi:hypothetical protein
LGSRHEYDISAAKRKVRLALRDWAGSSAKSTRARVRLIGPQVPNGRRTERNCVELPLRETAAVNRK